MKKKLILVLTLVICLIFSSFTLVGAKNVSYSQNIKNNEEITLNGLQYNNLAFLSSQIGQGLDSKLNISNIKIDNNELSLNSCIIAADGSKSDFIMKGKLYKPVIEGFGSNRAVVVADENNSNYEILHFSIETNANKEMLYRQDRKELAGKPIIKLYLKETGTRKVFFFEDILDTKTNNISNIMSNRITINLTRGKSEDELKSFTDEELNLE